ncbi:hypothetical protein BJ875DRAFT_469609 [Amylocarpus encephaloides]|uniref:Uncharacterized protein n=1 Tax=Amylocarpus encephaloides TaxID=45428 RepID=A0A9P7YDV2_9HELO|nr:hypothetical protein BJ875DRAFT_469609 [Amylocarpus encephaloides]
MAGWAASGLFPFNPDRVLRVTPKPPAQSTIPRADEIKVGSCYQDEVPQTTVTLVLVEGLTSLHNLIKQDAHTLNETSIQRLERHIQKLANAAQASFTKRALLHDQNQMLIKMNNEAKVRRSTRSIVLGKAKVMSFEDIEVARAARATKDVIKGKGKRGRKRKSVALETGDPDTEADPEVVYTVNCKRGYKRQRKMWSEAQECYARARARARSGADNRSAKPWRAPVGADDLSAGCGE